MQKRKAFLEEKLQEINRQLAELPEGKLICTYTGPYVKWIHSDGQTKTYLPKSRREDAEKLAAKKYLLLQKKDLENEKRAVIRYLEAMDRYPPKAEALLTEPTEYQKLLAPYFTARSDKLEAWAEAEYPQNPIHREYLVHQIGREKCVRSKSEAMIGKELQRNQIPFRYECALELNGKVFYPDFTIRHPRTGEEFYWEHFGMMDEPMYLKHMLSKMDAYVSNNIVPMVNLIATYETKEHPLSFEIIEEIIGYYFG